MLLHATYSPAVQVCIYELVVEGGWRDGGAAHGLMDLTGTSWGAQLRNSGVRAQGDRGTGSLGMEWTIRGSTIDPGSTRRYMHFAGTWCSLYVLWSAWTTRSSSCGWTFTSSMPRSVRLSVCLSVARVCVRAGEVELASAGRAPWRLGGRSLVQIAWRVRIRQPGACERQGNGREATEAQPSPDSRHLRSSPEEAPSQPFLSRLSKRPPSSD